MTSKEQLVKGRYKAGVHRGQVISRPCQALVKREWVPSGNAGSLRFANHLLVICNEIIAHEKFVKSHSLLPVIHFHASSRRHHQLQHSVS